MADEEKAYRVEEAEGAARDVEIVDSGSLAILNKSEINQQIATAKEYPRSIKNFRNEAMELATLNEKVAEECLYAIPRAGKTIEGPSARFAEILTYSWGNIRVLDRVIGEDDKFVTSQGIAFDVERNVVKVREVQRRITNKQGRRFDDDMVNVTKNAASSIASRNAVLALIPKALWNEIYLASRQAAIGNVKTLANKRSEMIAHFQKFGITPEQIYATVGVVGLEDIGLDELATLKGIATSIKEGDITPENAFQVPEKPGKTGMGMAGLKDLMNGAVKAPPEQKKPPQQAKTPPPEPELPPEDEEPFPEEETPPEEPKEEKPPAKPPEKKAPPKKKPEPEQPLLKGIIDQMNKVKAGSDLDDVVKTNLPAIQKMSEEDKARISEAYQTNFARLNG